MVMVADFRAAQAAEKFLRHKRRSVTYAQLVEKLAKIGVEEKEVNVRNKLSRGAFTAAYLIQCTEAIGVKDLRLS
jgi:Domain of unknown function (DUF6471)